VQRRWTESADHPSTAEPRARSAGPGEEEPCSSR
jgi:hypothetical protein